MQLNNFYHWKSTKIPKVPSSEFIEKALPVVPYAGHLVHLVGVIVKVDVEQVLVTQHHPAQSAVMCFAELGTCGIFDIYQ